MSNTEQQIMRFLIADDHMIVRQGLRILIDELFPNSVFDHASTIRQLMARTETELFDVIVLDAQFPDGMSLSSIPIIKKRLPKTKLLIFTSFDEEDYSLKFISAGADGFLGKLSSEAEIKVALVQLVSSGVYHPPLTQKLLDLAAHNPALINPLTQLSERELEISRLFAQGYGNLEVANELDVKQNTISTFKKKIFEKLKIQNMIELNEIIRKHDTETFA